MYLDYLVGDHDAALDVAKKNPEYAFVELYDSRIGDNTIFGVTFKKNREEPVGVIISFDCWQCSNESFNMECLYKGIADYMERNKDVYKGIILIGPDENEIKQAASKINNMLEKMG